MRRQPKGRQAADKGATRRRNPSPLNTPTRACRPAPAPFLIAPGTFYAIPTLDGTLCTLVQTGSQEVAAALAVNLIRAGIADPNDWSLAKDSHDAAQHFVGLTVERFIKQHGGRESDAFDLHVQIGFSPCSTAYLHGSFDRTTRLFMSIDTASSAYCVLGPTLKLLEAEHPRLPITFLHCIGSLNKFLRVYNHYDAEEYIEIWRDGLDEGDENTVPELKVPECLRRRKPLRCLPAIQTRKAAKLMHLAMSLRQQCDARVKAPEIDEDVQAAMMDLGDALPAMLCVFEKHDTVEGMFDNYCQYATENGNWPNVVLGFDATDLKKVRWAFNYLRMVLGAADTMARLISAMPGNEKPVRQEVQGEN